MWAQSSGNVMIGSGGVVTGASAHQQLAAASTQGRSYDFKYWVLSRCSA
jgi:hypothetical protein